MKWEKRTDISVIKFSKKHVKKEIKYEFTGIYLPAFPTKAALLTIEEIQNSINFNIIKQKLNIQQKVYTLSNFKNCIINSS